MKDALPDRGAPPLLPRPDLRPEVLLPQKVRVRPPREVPARPQQGVLVLPLQEALVLPCPEAPRTTAAGVVPACRGVLRTTAADLPRAFHAVRSTKTEQVAALLKGDRPQTKHLLQ